MKKAIRFLAEKPLIFDVLRRIVEVNHITLKKVIKKEFALDGQAKKNFTDEKILDVPCGIGEFSILFRRDCYYGLDISKKYIDYAQRKYKRRFFCRDVLQSGFENCYFDKILIIGFLHHLDDASVNSALKEVKRILKPDGMLLLIEDAPITAKYNIIGKIILNNDLGTNIRSGIEYKTILEKHFIIEKCYNVKSSFFNYSVFVLSSNLKT